MGSLQQGGCYFYMMPQDYRRLWWKWVSEQSGPKLATSLVPYHIGQKTCRPTQTQAWEDHHHLAMGDSPAHAGREGLVTGISRAKQL